MSQDYFDIRQLCERYVDAVNRRDAEAWVETWAPDGVWEYGLNDPAKGHSELIEFWNYVMQNMDAVFLTVDSGVVDSVGEEEAKARWYHTERIQLKDHDPVIGETVSTMNSCASKACGGLPAAATVCSTRATTRMDASTRTRTSRAGAKTAARWRRSAQGKSPGRDRNGQANS